MNDSKDSTFSDSQIEENSNCEPKVITELQSKLKFYEDHIVSILSKAQETFDSFNKFRNYYLQNRSDPDGPYPIFTPTNLNEEQIRSLLNENAQLQADFERSCTLLQQQKEMIERLSHDNDDLQKALNISKQSDSTDETIEKLQKENQDLQSLYEMISNVSDEVSAKNQVLCNQIDQYKAQIEEYKQNKVSLENKVLELKNEVVRINQIVRSNQTTPSQLLSNESIKADNSTSSTMDEDLKQRIVELETKSEYLENELNRTAANLEKSIKQQETLKAEQKKQLINLTNAKNAIDQYQKIEGVLLEKLQSEGIELPQYLRPIDLEL